MTIEGLDVSRWQSTTPNLTGLPERFWSKVEIGDCWTWTAATTYGYGVFRNARVVRAHRLVYETLVGPIPAGLELDHLCRNRRCVNPDHLEAVTHAENLRRGQHSNQNVAKDACPRGHELQSRGGRRYCKTCSAASRQAHAPSHRAARAAYAREYRRKVAQRA